MTSPGSEGFPKALGVLAHVETTSRIGRFHATRVDLPAFITSPRLLIFDAAIGINVKSNRS